MCTYENTLVDWLYSESVNQSPQILFVVYYTHWYYYDYEFIQCSLTGHLFAITDKHYMYRDWDWYMGNPSSIFIIMALLLAFSLFCYFYYGRVCVSHFTCLTSHCDPYKGIIKSSSQWILPLVSKYLFIAFWNIRWWTGVLKSVLGTYSLYGDPRFTRFYCCTLSSHHNFSTGNK